MCELKLIPMSRVKNIPIPQRILYMHGNSTYYILGKEYEIRTSLSSHSFNFTKYFEFILFFDIKNTLLLVILKLLYSAIYFYFR